MSISSRARRAAIALAIGAGAIAVPTAIAAPSAETAATAESATFEQPLGSAESVAAAAGKRAYLVLFDPAAPASTVTAVKQAVVTKGGTVFAAYDAIGVLVAHSTSATFAADLRPVAGVQQVGATRTTDVPAAADNPAIPSTPSQTTPTASETSRYDMTIIGADRAWAVNQGSPSVTVGVLDTGVDDQHYDLKANFDASKSASCAYGKLDTRAGAWREVHTHGTHVAGTIAAAKNGKGMVGVAPGVKIASVRVAEPTTSLFFPENTICAFVFAGDQGFDVTNNSYYTDPWMFNCPSDKDQAAILEGVKRSIQYSENKGVLNIAASGNENYNLAAKTTDTTSPDDSTPVTRTITNDCLDLPAEIPGVVAVSSITSSNAKSSFSNFGLNKIHVAGPGSGVYSTVPGGGYATYDGTSMASPHVAGVAALLASTHPNDTPAQLRALLNTQADDLACPSDSRCTGTTANNAFFGEGRVDAFEAVNTGTPGNTVTVTNPGNQTGTVGTAVSLQIQASDSDPNQTLTYSATGLPAGLTINASTGLISGTPTAAATSSVTVTVKDTTNASKSVTFSWTVNPTTPPTGVLVNGVPVTGLAGAQGASLRFQMNVPAGVTNLRFVTSGGTGDADLYAKFGTAPTTSVNDCRSTGSATAETCTIATPSAGTYHVLLYGYSAFSGVTLTGSYAADSTVALTNGVGKGPLSGAAGSAQFFKLDVPSGATNLRFTLAGGTGDADLYVRSGSKPTTSSYTCKSDGATTTETCTISSITPGTYYVLVQGYSAYSGTTLTGSYTP
ncbi:S8 family serine peptidase [Actinokineospora sp. HUAS TT18]|uniref:S8 family serine peptidase n=1 Tax=Actinokineospora sp. HUAS TT18 TaxID=3447451 RepID=UPI003F524B6B